MAPIRHPFVPISIVFAAGIALGSFAELPLAWLLSAGPAAAGGAIACAIRGEARASLAAGLFSILLAGASWGALDARPFPDDLSLLVGERAVPARLRATVREAPLPPHPAESDARGEPFVIDIAEAERDGRPVQVSGRALLRLDGPADGIGPGDSVELLCVLRRPPGRNSPGGYDRRKALAREGVRLEAEAPVAAVRVVARGCALSPRRTAWTVRSRLAAGIRAALPQRESELLIALLLGQRLAVDPADRAQFSRSGLGHVLAVSGLHLAILAALAGRLLGVLGLRERPAAAVLACLAIFYAVLAGGRPPILRAAAMVSTYLAATVLWRDRDARNSVALAAFGLLVWRPGWLFDPGFQLSFAAVGFLAFLYPLLEEAWAAWRGGVEEWMEPLPENRLERTLRRLRQAVFVSAAAWVGVQPLLLHYLGFLNPWAVLSNVVVLPLATVALGTGVVLLAAAATSQALAVLLAPLARASVWALLAGVELFASLPFATVRLASPGPAWLLGYYGLWMAFFAWADSRGAGAPAGHETPRGISRAAAAKWGAVAAALAGSAVALALVRGERPSAPSLTVLDAGASRAALVRTASGADILVNAGSPGREETLAKRLLDLGASRLAAVVLTRDDDARGSGLAAVLDDIGAELLALPALGGSSGLAREAAAAAGRAGIPVLWPRPPDELSSADGAAISWLRLGALEAVSVDAGAGLCVVFLDAPPRASWRRGFQPDQGPAPPGRRPARCDLLVLLDWQGGPEALREAARVLRPAAAVAAFSGTEAAFEGPAGAIAALSEEGIAVLRTDREGTLRVRLDGGLLIVERWDGAAWAERLRLGARQPGAALRDRQ